MTGVQTCALPICRALVLLAVGFALGALLMGASGRLLTAWLGYRFNGYDVVAALSVAILLAVCGVAASYLPARRASLIEPVVALRTE